MNALLVIISLIIVSLFIIRTYLTARRKQKILQLEKAYDDIEMYFIRNNIALKNDYIKLLKSFKNITVNPEFLDIRVLLAIERRIKVNKDHQNIKENHIVFKKVIEELGDEFEPLFKKFDEISSRILILSFYRSGFLIPITKAIVNKNLKIIISGAIKLISGNFKLSKNEEIIYYTGFDNKIVPC